MAEESKEGEKKVRAPLSLKSPQEVVTFLQSHAGEGGLSVIIFIQDWAESCASTYNVVVELANEAEQENIGFAEVVAEQQPEICDHYKIVGVPTVLFFRMTQEVDRVVGVRVREVASKLKFHGLNNILSSTLNFTTSPEKETVGGKVEPLNDRLKKLIESKDVIVFIKGTPSQPKCGFSRTIVQTLNDSGIPYGHFDILEDDEVRQGLKTYSNWQTYPQLYVKGQLIGGLDIVKELQQTDELISTLKGEC